MKKKFMRIDYFSDCISPNPTDDINSYERIYRRLESLFQKAKIKLIHTPNAGDTGTIHQIIDNADAVRYGKNYQYVVFCNAAPRGKNGDANGAPFCYATIGNTLIIGHLETFFPLVNTGIIREIKKVDVLDVCTRFLSDEAERIAKSQFRGFDFLPLLAKWILDGKMVPSKSIILEKRKEYRIWYNDVFANSKTTILYEDMPKFQNGDLVKLRSGGKSFELPCYHSLAEAPNLDAVGEKTLALVKGSSGIFDKRFMEVIEKGGRAAERVAFQKGSQLVLEELVK